MKIRIFIKTVIIISTLISFFNSSNAEQVNPDDLIKFMEHEKYDDRTGEPADPLLKILYKYSPDAYFIVTRNEDYHNSDIMVGDKFLRINKRLETGRITVNHADGKKSEKIIKAKGWKIYIETDKPFLNQVNQLAIAVHEENHGFAAWDSLYFLSRKIKSINEIMIPKGDGKNFIMLNFRSFYLNKNRTIYAVTRGKDNSIYSAFPAGKLMQFIPEDKKTSRYRTYIDKSYYQSTQITGISGFLDEYNSYYWSNKILYDLYDYYKQEQPQTRDVWVGWTGSVFSFYYSWAEFRYWILMYLMYAQKNEPEIYKSMMQDEHLRYAFTSIDDQFTDLVNKLFIRLGKELPEHLKKFNMRAGIEEREFIDMKNQKQKDIYYVIDNLYQGMHLKDFITLTDELKKPEYIEMANRIRMTPQNIQPDFEMLKKMFTVKK